MRRLIEFVDLHRNQILVLSAWALSLSVITLAFSVRFNSVPLENIWLFLGRPVFAVSFFLILALNLQKISKRSES